MDTIGERLAYTRSTILSMNQSNFSKILGISQGALSEIEKNRRGIPMEAIIELIKYSKENNSISCNWILTGEKEHNTHSELTNDENELVETYNQLDRRGQHRVHTIIYEELDRMKLSKKENNRMYESNPYSPMFVAESSSYGLNPHSTIPVLGYVAAGEPILSYENEINTIISESLKASYALIAKGNSMEPIIFDGEIIEVISQKELENGEIGIIKVDNAVTCKCFYSLEKQYELKSLNPDVEPIIISKNPNSNIQIIGKVALTDQQQKRYNMIYKK